MAFDAASGKTVLLGYDVGPVQRFKTFLWDGVTWISQDAGVDPRGAAIMVASPGGPILFGGDVGGTYSPDSFLWKDNAWQAQGVDGPPVIYGAMSIELTYSHGATFILYGGQKQDGTISNETWRCSWGTGDPFGPWQLTAWERITTEIGRASCRERV